MPKNYSSNLVILVAQANSVDRGIQAINSGIITSWTLESVTSNGNFHSKNGYLVYMINLVISGQSLVTAWVEAGSLYS